MRMFLRDIGTRKYWNSNRSKSISIGTAPHHCPHSLHYNALYYITLHITLHSIGTAPTSHKYYLPSTLQLHYNYITFHYIPTRYNTYNIYKTSLRYKIWIAHKYNVQDIRYKSLREERRRALNDSGIRFRFGARAKKGLRGQIFRQKRAAGPNFQAKKSHRANFSVQGMHFLPGRCPPSYPPHGFLYNQMVISQNDLICLGLDWLFSVTIQC